MMGSKAKDMASGGRFAVPGIGTDVVRVFNRALELVSSNSFDSENELLDLVRKAKREIEKEPFHLPKKARSGRVPAEISELQALGHRAVVGTSSADHNSIQPSAAGSDGGIGGTVSASSLAAAGNASMTQAQTRLMNVIRGGPGRGRIEKPKRKIAR